MFVPQLNELWAHSSSGMGGPLPLVGHLHPQGTFSSLGPHPEQEGEMGRVPVPPAVTPVPPHVPSVPPPCPQADGAER